MRLWRKETTKGLHMTAASQITREAILALLHEKPGITHGEIVRETGLAPNTVTKHLKAIRSGWEVKE